MLVFTRYTTRYALVCTIHSIREFFPPLLAPSLLTGEVWKFRLAEREILPVAGAAGGGAIF